MSALRKRAVQGKAISLLNEIWFALIYVGGRRATILDRYSELFARPLIITGTPGYVIGKDVILGAVGIAGSREESTPHAAVH
jgi:hypothetical protein